MNKHLIYDSHDVQIGSLGSKLYQHISNDDIHVTAEEKELLDKLSLSSSTGDTVTSDELSIELGNKADKDDIPTKVSLLENDLGFLTEIPDYYTTEEEVKLLIQELAGSGGDSDLSDLQDQIDELTTIVNQYGLTIEELRQLIDQNTSDITNLEETIQNIEQQITNIDNRVTNIEENGSGDGSSSYVLPIATGTQLGGVKIGSGIDVTSDGTISVASSSSGSGDWDITDLDDRYLRKTTDDETPYNLTAAAFYGNKFESGNFSSGMTGTGVYVGNTAPDNSDTYSHIEVDNLLVRNKAEFTELEIRKLSYVNGNLVLSAAGGIIESVVDQGDSWKCYLKSDDGTTATTNTFEVNDLVRCQTFDIKEGVYENVSNKFYWRQVIEVGSENNKNYIVLDKDNCAGGSDDPEAGDTIVQFGNTSDSNRQNIIIISSTDDDSPAIKMYSGVISYDMDDAVLNTIISPGQVAFRTDLFRLISGSTYSRVCIDRGAYDSSTVYYYWDRVSYDGSLWLNVYQEGTTQGITPGTNSSRWMLQVSKGEDGKDGEDGEDGSDGSDGEAIEIGGGYSVYINPTSITADYTTQFDSEGKIQSFSLSNISVNINVYKNGVLIDNAEVHTGSSDGSVQISCLLTKNGSISGSTQVTITPMILNSTITARCVLEQSDIGYTTDLIDSNLVTSGSTLYWPVTSGTLTIGVYVPDEGLDNYFIDIPVNLNIVGATSFWEVTADHWVSQFMSIDSDLDTITTNISSITLTSEEIVAFLGEYLSSGQTLESVLEMLAGSISMATIIDNLRVAGINISASDDGTPTGGTGSVEIYGDKVTIKNTEGGDDILWVEDGTANMDNVAIVGGTIGGFKIANGEIGEDDSADFVDNNKMHLTRSGITFTELYTEDEPGTRYIALNNHNYLSDGATGFYFYDNDSSSTAYMTQHKYGAHIEFSEASTYLSALPLALFAFNGSIVTNKACVGYGVENLTNDGSNYQELNYKYGSTFFVYSTTTNTGVVLPTYENLMNAIYSGRDWEDANNGQYGSVRVTVINSPNSSHSLRVFGYNTDYVVSSGGDLFPTLYNTSGSLVDYVTIGTGRALDFILYFRPTSGGSKAYWAFVVTS